MSRHMTDCAGDDYCGGSCVATGISATTNQHRCSDFNCGAAQDEDHTPQCFYYKPGLIPRDELNVLKAALRYNSTNMGELGRRVRLEHALSCIDRFVQRVERAL